MFLRKLSGGRVAALPLAALLAACSGDAPGEASVSGDAPSDAEIMAQAQNVITPEPGLYRSVSTVSAFSQPGASAQEAERLQEAVSALEPQESSVCLTQEDADEGWTAMLRELEDGECEVESFSATEDGVQARLACQSPGGISSQLEMTGTATSQSSQMEIRIEQVGESLPGGRQELQLSIESERIGDC